MTNSSDKNDQKKWGTAKTGSPSAEEAFARATELHQHGNISEAMRLYRQIIERFPYSPKAELSKTLIAGMQKERIKILWDTAWDARSQCNAPEALKLYRMIMEESPGSPEAKSAKAELTSLTELVQLWNAALAIQSQGNEPKAVELYRQIVERSPNSPESENAGLMMAIIGQNQLLPRGEVTQDYQFGKNTPEMILSHFLAHKKTTSGAAGTPPEAAVREEQHSKKIESLWTQAVALAKDGNTDEAVILYNKIITSSANGHRVRDAKYQIEKIKSRAEEVQKSCRRRGVDAG
jgi:tetratricopeptide (TPR) repeat protein